MNFRFHHTYVSGLGKDRFTLIQCSTLFKSQLLSLRKALASQLVSPTLFGGQVMTAKSLTSLVTLVVGALNKVEHLLILSLVFSTAVESEGGSNNQTRTDSKLFKTSFLI